MSNHWISIKTGSNTGGGSYVPASSPCNYGAAQRHYYVADLPNGERVSSINTGIDILPVLHGGIAVFPAKEADPGNRRFYEGPEVTQTNYKSAEGGGGMLLVVVQGDTTDNDNYAEKIITLKTEENRAKLSAALSGIVAQMFDRPIAGYNIKIGYGGGLSTVRKQIRRPQWLTMPGRQTSAGDGTNNFYKDLSKITNWKMIFSGELISLNMFTGNKRDFEFEYSPFLSWPGERGLRYADGPYGVFGDGPYAWQGGPTMIGGLWWSHQLPWLYYGSFGDDIYLDGPEPETWGWSTGVGRFEYITDLYTYFEGIVAYLVAPVPAEVINALNITEYTV